MSKKMYAESNIQAIANAIRSKTGSTDTYTTSEMPQAIAAIETKEAEYIALIERSITTVNIPEGITKIGAKAFANCDSLHTVNIPEGATAIGAEAFAYCGIRGELILPSTISTFGSNAFMNCRNITKIVIPYGAKSFTTRTFGNCSGMTDLVVPSTITSIGGSSFEGCSSLTNVTLGEGENTFNVHGLNLSASTLYSQETLHTMITNLKDRSGETTAFTLTLGATNLEKISDEYKALATSKNWTLA